MLRRVLLLFAKGNLMSSKKYFTVQIKPLKIIVSNGIHKFTRTQDSNGLHY